MAKNIYFRQGVHGDRLQKVKCPNCGHLLENPIRKILFKINEIFLKRKQLVLITSIDESSEHRADSFHYQNAAIDVKDASNEAINKLLFKDLKMALGKDYDIIWHKGSHFHIEFDPD